MRATRRGVKNLIEVDQLLRARAEGLSTKQIAERYGLSGSRVAASIRRAVQQHQKRRPRDVEALRARETAMLEMLRTEAIDAWSASKSLDSIGDPSLLTVAASLSDQVARLNGLVVQRSAIDLRAGSPRDFRNWTDTELIEQAQKELDAVRATATEPDQPPAITAGPELADDFGSAEFDDAPTATAQAAPGATIDEPPALPPRLVPVVLPGDALEGEVMPAESLIESMFRYMETDECLDPARKLGMDV